MCLTAFGFWDLTSKNSKKNAGGMKLIDFTLSFTLLKSFHYCCSNNLQMANVLK